MQNGISENKRSVKFNKFFSKRVMVLSILGVFSLAMVLSYSMALFSRQYEGRKADFIVGDLTYKMESSALNSNYQITLAPGEKKQLNLTLSSLNDISSKYEIYYSFVTSLTDTEAKQIEVGYLSNTLSLPSGVIDQKESLVVTVKIVNNLSKNVTLSFGVTGGLEQNALELTKGFAIDHSMRGSDVILAATLDGTPLETFPTQADNYGVKSVTCTDNAVGTFKTSNWSFVVEDFTRNETECTVDFSKSLTVGQTSPIITSTKEEMNQEILDGKTSIATALTNMGVATSNTDSFTTMANNISQVSGNSKIVVKKLLADSSGKSMNLSSYEGYQNFKLWENIFPMVHWAKINSSSVPTEFPWVESAGANISASYNASTGALSWSASCGGSTGKTNPGCSFRYDVYLVTIE